MTAEQIAFHVQYAAVDAHPETDVAAAAERILRAQRVLAAVRHDIADEAIVLVPVTESGAVVALDDAGALQFELTAGRLRELFAAEGLTLHLEHPDDQFDELDAALDEEFGDAFEELDDDAVFDDRVLTDDLAGFGMPGDGDDLPEEEFAVEPVRVAEFSRRGPWAARITAQILKTEVDYVEHGSWSLYRYETVRPHMLISGGRADGAVIELNLPHIGEAWVEVTAAAGGAPALFWPNAERLTRPVLELDAIANEASAELYRRMLAELDGTRDELRALASGTRVDVDAAHRACLPEAVGGLEGEDARVRAFVAAFGVPEELIEQALTDAASDVDARRFAPRGWWPLAGEIALGGIGETTPLTRRDRPLPRLERALRQRPMLDAALSTAELVAGLAMARGRSRFGRVVGVLIAIDAVADLVLWVVRRRRR